MELTGVQITAKGTFNIYKVDSGLIYEKEKTGNLIFVPDSEEKKNVLLKSAIMHLQSKEYKLKQIIGKHEVITNEDIKFVNGIIEMLKRVNN